MPRKLRPPRLEQDDATRIWRVVWFDQLKRQSRRLSLETEDAAEAERRFANFLLDKRDADATAGRGALTVGAALDLYWTEHATARRRDGSPKVIDQARIEVTIRNLKLGLAGKAVESLGEADVTAYSQKRAAGVLGYAQGGQSGPKPVKDGTIRRELQTLVAALNWNREAGRLLKVPKIDVGTPPPARFRVLTPAEWFKLRLAAWPDQLTGEPVTIVGQDQSGRILREEIRTVGRYPRLYRFLMIAMHAPARRRAIEGLMWTQVDRTARIIDFNPPGARQSNKRRPIVPINDALWPVLERAFREKTSLHVLDHPGSIRTSFENALERAGLTGTGITIHTLRHTHATWSLAAGTDPWKVAGMLGDSVQTVLRNYGHHHPDYLREAANFGVKVREAGEG